LISSTYSIFCHGYFESCLIHTVYCIQWHLFKFYFIRWFIVLRSQWSLIYFWNDHKCTYSSPITLSFIVRLEDLRNYCTGKKCKSVLFPLFLLFIPLTGDLLSICSYQQVFASCQLSPSVPYFLLCQISSFVIVQRILLWVLLIT
jgi:hypothetical protein